MGEDVERVKRALPSVREIAEDEGIALDGKRSDLRGDALPIHPGEEPAEKGDHFSVDDGQDVWTCYRHKSGGSAFELIAVAEGLCSCGDLAAAGNSLAELGVFRETLEIAAARVGVELSDSPRAGMDDDERERFERDDDVRRQVAEYYHGLLDEHGLRAELKARYGFSDELIDEHYIGYAPPAGPDNDLPGNTDADLDRLVELGLVYESGRPLFVDRFVFPYWIFDGLDRKVRYFAGRDVSGDAHAKYLKIQKDEAVRESASAEPPFGLTSIRKAKRVVVTEGVTDALALIDHGFAAVSPVTTSIAGDSHGDFARRLKHKTVTVVMDEDRTSGDGNPGLRGAARVAHVLAERGVDVRVARLPCKPGDDIDVADYFLDHDPYDFRTEVLGGRDDQFPAGVAWWAWGDGHFGDLFGATVEDLGYDPDRAVKRKTEDGTVYFESIDTLVEPADTLAEARRRFYHGGKTAYSAAIHKETYHKLICWVCEVRGEVFATPSGEVHYYDREHNRTYKLCTRAKQEANSEFRYWVERTLGISTSDWGRELLNSVARKYAAEAPERPLARLGYYDEAEGELYVNRFDGHYYALDGDGIELRRNGTDVFFRPVDDAEPYEYIPDANRDDVPHRVPGEQSPFVGTGDLVHRFFSNRVNYDEHANLGPSLQRLQLYVHLHALPFVRSFGGKPIMAWVGRKGSGKTVMTRSIGQWLFGPDWSEGAMGESRDDFTTQVANRTLVFIDNYDDSEPWVNDILASVATGTSIKLRELYTTADLTELKPQCFIALTSRDPPFRRDDVADRCLVFRVQRVDAEDGFVGESDFLKQPQIYRDDIWSDYLDNLNRIVAVKNADDDPYRTTTHRMADWALFAQDTAEALDIDTDRVADLLDGITTERAHFALEDEPIRLAIEEYLDRNPAGTNATAGDLFDDLEAAAGRAGVPWPYGSARGLANGLSSLSDELNELFGMEVIRRRSDPNRYEFPGVERDGRIGRDFGGDE